jgi:hypothetical protein
MVTKNKSAKKQVKIGNLKLNKETVKDLSKQDAKAVKGGFKGGTASQVVTGCQRQTL